MSDIIPHAMHFNKVSIHRALHSGDYELSLANKFGPDTHLAALGSVMWNKLTPGGMAPTGSIVSVEEESLQLLMDALWKVGIRPTSDEVVETKSPQEDALKAHISDLKDITWHLLGKKKSIKTVMEPVGLPDIEQDFT
ncbi:hypothetical protein UFOVP26_128 [uncultured Caudovirales phage]|uniref:Uncharacterized protein n=1 Tax=uncultured Caudovirales phage TaxID=2100421 RepID=A0A6J5KLQ2_9CAUD|nr:hypothetical protein UFOVP26_128 [uncultured Caudovirales phage]CAB4123976.1 hypothetical protein UFOVP44_107 [uncultured Caudovirales phage]CAB5219549.1 hypothetical protein UFOVP220_98 [uncultured Caudovirales phage]